jgi:hypothetical protein
MGEVRKSGAVPVELRREPEGWRLYRGGAPYYVKGAVYWEDPTGAIPLQGILERGGNSVRVGGPHLERILEEAARLGMTVTVGLPMKMEYVHKFNYSDERAVREQFEAVKAVVKRYKNHPALLMWGVGNELPLFYTDKKLWDAVNQVAEMIHEVDGKHPAMTVIGDSPPFEEAAAEIKARCPAIDLLGINAYKDLPEVPERLRRGGWEKAYCVTEWGPSGNWQVPKTRWGAPIEETSTEKAAVYRHRYEQTMGRDRELCVGSYVFFWQWKMEATHTWFGMFLETGERTETVNLMQYLWSGEWPANRAPRVEGMTIGGRAARDDVTLKPGERQEAVVMATDPDGDPLTYRWEILPEVKPGLYAGMGEERAAPLPDLIHSAPAAKIAFTAPQEPGAYRLFVFVLDGQGNAATANVPFFVQE